MTSYLTLITCTGFRPEAFKLSIKWLENQTFRGPIQWIIVSDEPGFIAPKKLASNGNILIEHFVSPVVWTPGNNTQRANMELAISKVKGEKIIIWEDDERYAPTYLERMSKYLDNTAAVGEVNATYYHLKVPGFKSMHNFRHASLCQTGFRLALLPLLKAAVISGEMFFDVHFWRQVFEQKLSCVLFSGENLCVGMKGMPGREGLGVGHKMTDYAFDSNLLQLKVLLGDDYKLYKGFTRYADQKEKPVVTAQNKVSTKSSVIKETFESPFSTDSIGPDIDDAPADAEPKRRGRPRKDRLEDLSEKAGEFKENTERFQNSQIEGTPSKKMNLQEVAARLKVL